MQNNQLRSKIEKVGYCIFTFFFWYLVIGFFLQSNYPIYDYPFNRDVAYETLRDGLTLSAYFLAPAMAYVLFEDWRIQHKLIRAENLYDDVDSSIDDAYQKAENLMLDITQRTVGADFVEKIIKNNEDLDRLLKSTYRKIALFKYDHTKEGQLFINKADSLLQQLSSVYFQILFIKADLVRLESDDENEVLASKVTIKLNVHHLIETLDVIKKDLPTLKELKPTI